MQELAPGAKFQAIACDQLRQAQLDKSPLGGLLDNLKAEANSLGIDITGSPAFGGWPYALPGPFDEEVADVLRQVETRYNNWVAAGRPAPPPRG